MGFLLRRVFHWGPLAVLGIIKLITWATINIISMWWPPPVAHCASVNTAVFLGLAMLTLYYFLQSLLEGPGFVPLRWRPENEEDTQYLQYCLICEGYKAPRSHHCRKCGRCVMKMDHHCPWINCCVGHANHRYFNLFLLFAVCGCLQASIILTIGLYHAINRVWYLRHGTGREPLVVLSLGELLATLLAVGMAVGVVLAVGALLYFQIRGILRNRTTIEDWIMEKAVSRRAESGGAAFVFPYDRGALANLWHVFAARGDGIHWPLAEGCGPYDLTREQIAQKAEKRVRARLYAAVAAYSGRCFPLGRPRAACAAPCTDEPRLPLQPGDRIRATRQRRYWLFGEKLVGESSPFRGPRGWFPRDAVLPVDKPEYKAD
ncbi:palmitoyltransferase ZDHHC6 [Epargyreus clarus]|uniref:palmitoyltransferase ZDHHC6 n=1 Tax=Epargyreus clarus TaxID=520877 RepID=UPI003C2EB0C3